MKISETYKAWLAGFLDGEGSICFANSSCKHPRVVLYQKDQLDLLMEIHDLYGGIIRFMRSGYSKGVHGLNFERKQDIVKFLSDVLPYLRIKHEKAELMIAICSIYVGKNQSGFQVEKSVKAELREEFRSLQ